jgi:CBS-domain-containing membrane protein
MKARDVMVFPVIAVKPSDTVQEVAKKLLEHRISAVPVVDETDRIVGIVSEGDLLHRVESGTERRRSWWLLPFLGEQAFAADYVKAHAKKVSDVMTRNVITASPETPLHEIAALLEKHAIKRVPIAIGGRLRGIVSRANLIQAVATMGKALNAPSSDAAIRDQLLAHLRRQPWAHTTLLNVTVNDGVVDLWGFTSSEGEREAIRVAAESTSGVCAVNDNLVVRRMQAWQ